MHTTANLRHASLKTVCLGVGLFLWFSRTPLELIRPYALIRELMAKSATEGVCLGRQMKSSNTAPALGARDTQRASKVEVRSVKAGLYHLDLQSLDHRGALASAPPYQALRIVDIRPIQFYLQRSLPHLYPGTACNLTVTQLKYTKLVKLLDSNSLAPLDYIPSNITNRPTAAIHSAHILAIVRFTEKSLSLNRPRL